MQTFPKHRERSGEEWKADPLRRSLPSARVSVGRVRVVCVLLFPEVFLFLWRVPFALLLSPSLSRLPLLLAASPFSFSLLPSPFWPGPDLFKASGHNHPHTNRQRHHTKQTQTKHKHTLTHIQASKKVNSTKKERWAPAPLPTRRAARYFSSLFRRLSDKPQQRSRGE